MITATEARMKTSKYNGSVDGCLEVIYYCIEQVANMGNSSMVAAGIHLSDKDKDEIKSNLIENGFYVDNSEMGFIITW